jgi:hypothetical protein
VGRRGEPWGWGGSGAARVAHQLVDLHLAHGHADLADHLLDLIPIQLSAAVSVDHVEHGLRRDVELGGDAKDLRP